MTTTDVSRSGLWAVLVGTALLAASLQAVNLSHLANRFGCDPVRLTCPGPEVPWVTSDTDTYMEVAREILDLGVLRASYLRRTPGYPLLLATSITVGARLRFPLDLLFMPVVAAFLPSFVARRRWMADAVVRRPGAVLR